METGFKERFALFFNHVGESQSGFADRAGIQQVTVSQLLSGRSKPSLKTANKLRDAFQNLNMDWLLDGHGEMLHDASAPAMLRRAPAVDSPLRPVLSSEDEKWYKEQIRQKDEHIKLLTELLRSGGDLSRLGSFSLGSLSSADGPALMKVA